MEVSQDTALVIYAVRILSGNFKLINKQQRGALSFKSAQIFYFIKQLDARVEVEVEVKVNNQGDEMRILI